MSLKQIDNIIIKRISYFNIYLIKGKTGDILIDTGFVFMRKKLKKFLDKHNVKLIILTHAHVDHIWNVAYLKKLYNCEVALGADDIENIDNKKIQAKPLRPILTLWTNIMNWGMQHFIAKPFKVDYHLKDNQTINKYGLSIKIHNLSGHTNGSIGIKYKDYLFVGDALVNRGRVTEAYQNQNTNNAKKSAQKILSLKPKIIFFGHDKYADYSQLEKSLLTK